jgi:hypothetical protein
MPVSRQCLSTSASLFVTPYACGYRDAYRGEDAARTDPGYVQGFCDGFRDRADDPPCKNEGFVVVGNAGECLRCGADQGEGCRS